MASSGICASEMLGKPKRKKKDKSSFMKMNLVGS
jgi:hypothetical protein